MIGIVDISIGNLTSIKNAIEYLGFDSEISDNPEKLKDSSHIILPGVGSFRNAMKSIKENHIDEALHDIVFGEKKPILGICLGMQIMAESGTEDGVTPGLGWIKGRVEKLSCDDISFKVPHIGWNNFDLLTKSKLFNGVKIENDFYFVHSYHVVCENEDNIIAQSSYCNSFVSAFNKDNIYGVQFHPEKSQDVGLKVLENFCTL